MSKSINIMFSLKDQFTAPLQRAQKSTKNMNREFKKASNSVKSFGNSIKSGMAKVAKSAAVGFLAVSAAVAVFAKQSIDAAKAQLKVEKTLTENMKRTTNATQEQIQSVKNLASALQNEGIIGDEVALAGAARLAVYKLNSEQINKLLPNLNDMLAHEKGFNATQEDSIAMADAIGKALDGKVKGLLKYGVALTESEEKLFKTMTQEQRLNLISSKLTKSIGGANKALRETDEGRIVAANNAWGDMKEELGKKLLPYLGAFSNWFVTKIPQIQNLILSIADKIESMVSIATPYILNIKTILGQIFDDVSPALDIFYSYFQEGFNILGNTLKFFIKNWDLLSPVIYTVIGALIAYKAVMFISNTYTLAMITALKIKTAIETFAAGKMTLLTAAQWALNIAMNANPIGLIITGIAALIAIGILMYKNWDKIIEFFKEAWAMVKDAFASFCEYIKSIFQPLWDGLVAGWDYLVEAFNSVCDTISDIFMPIWDGLGAAIDAILHPIQTAKNAIGGLVDSVLSFFGSDDEKTIEVKETKDTSNSTSLPGHALGTSYFAGGVTKINEGGRDETAILPSGTKILSHEQSKKASSNNIEVNININGNVIGNKEFMEQTGSYIAEKIKLAIGNI